MSTAPSILYGIKNCDTMKKARAWLDARDVVYRFHDYRVDGIDRPTLLRWCERVGWERLLNRAGTTYRKLPEADRRDVNQAKAVALMLAQPAMIKRPVLDANGKLLVGFDAQEYRQLLA